MTSDRMARNPLAQATDRLAKVQTAIGERQ
jgi:hypothetical protein